MGFDGKLLRRLECFSFVMFIMHALADYFGCIGGFETSWAGWIGSPYGVQIIRGYLMPGLICILPLPLLERDILHKVSKIRIEYFVKLGRSRVAQNLAFFMLDSKI